MSDREILLSFVIPAKNEEGMLPGTIDSIVRTLAGSYPYEIIVVDNGSTDETVAVATAMGALVVRKPEGSIGALRNYGASFARSDLLVFLDADVTLDSRWAAAFWAVLRQFNTDHNMITGSRCSTPAADSWISHAWYWAGSEAVSASHVGSGHMIISRALFERLGGFDSRLQTGEDYDLCERAFMLGAKVTRNQSLRVYHHGSPQTLRAFVRREMWHGAGDLTSVRRLLQSKVALLGLFFLAAHLLLAAAAASGHIEAAMTCALLIAGICLLSTLRKHRGAPLPKLMQNTLLFYCYYWARNMAMLNRIFPLLSSGSPRVNSGC